MILHIANDFSGSKVYKNLIGELDQLKVPQIVYTAIRDSQQIGKNDISFNVTDSKIIYSNILNKTTDRLLYKSKINKICKDIESKINLSTITMIHAHTWFSDGGVAYLLSQKYKLPYIIAVRNTDLNVHYKYLINSRSFGRKILSYAKRIVLIGEYQKHFFNQLPKSTQKISEKIQVIPNGVDKFWIANSKAFDAVNIECYNILYVGSFIKRKRLVELQKALIKISADLNNVKCKLHIVGGANSNSRKIFDLIKSHPDIFVYHGQINCKEDLLKIYNYCQLFAMPSKQETFGLVYVEALLQGLPILYTENEGIDGFYNERIGEKVREGTVEDIEKKLLLMFDNFSQYNIPTGKLIKNHNWCDISKTYLNLYKQ